MTNHEGRTTTERSICRMGPATRQGNIATEISGAESASLIAWLASGLVVSSLQCTVVVGPEHHVPWRGV